MARGAGVSTSLTFDAPTRPTDWRARAACRYVDGELFFTLSSDWRAHWRPEQVAEAKAVCARCPVIVSCRDAADKEQDRHAIRGGMTPVEREQAQRTPPRRRRA